MPIKGLVFESDVTPAGEGALGAEPAASTTEARVDGTELVTSSSRRRSKATGRIALARVSGAPVKRLSSTYFPEHPGRSFSASRTTGAHSRATIWLTCSGPA
jgi:hypothetical protein